MSLEQEAVRLDELPTIPSSMDPILTNPTASQPLTSARVAAVLPDRARSLTTEEYRPPRLDEAPDLDNYTVHVIPVSPTRANVKRRRSVASAPGDILGRRLSRRNSTTLSDRDNFYRPPNDEALIARHGRSRSSEQTSTLRRQDKNREMLGPIENEAQKRRKVEDEDTSSSKPAIKMASNTKKPRGPPMPQLPLFRQEEYNNNKQVKYERKGAFWLRKDREEDEFRVLKPRGQPESRWRAGDGFSEDEVRPNFSPFTSIHNQRRPELLLGMGTLQLESGTASQDDVCGPRASTSKTQLSQHGMRTQRSTENEVWPTKDNFTEKLGPRRHGSEVPENGETISSSMLAQPDLTPQNKDPFFLYKLPTSRKRKHSDFENFGRHLIESSNLQSIDNMEHRGLHTDYIQQSEMMDEMYEFEEAYETDQEDILVPSTPNDNDFDEDEEFETGHEDDSEAIRSRESSARDSAIFVDDAEDGQRKVRCIG
ncbi:hypothetical protein F5Y11DRAFT_362413 [Daldinia sp. FL1419]|nr:hypothetical protein F5Y11DRAFT_362413 [Daldinia sp. FL1419]